MTTGSLKSPIELLGEAVGENPLNLEAARLALANFNAELPTLSPDKMAAALESAADPLALGVEKLEKAGNVAGRDEFLGHITVHRLLKDGLETKPASKPTKTRRRKMGGRKG